MRSISPFLGDEKGAITTEFVTLVPFFIGLFVFFADVCVVYLTHSEMWNVARDSVRRMSTEEFTTNTQVVDYVSAHLFLGERSYVVEPTFGGEMRVRIAISIADAAIFGYLMENILGNTIVADVVMRKEPLQ